MKQLYVVHIEHEIIVVAEDEKEALKHAGKALSANDLDIGIDDMTARLSRKLTVGGDNLNGISKGRLREVFAEARKTTPACRFYCTRHIRGAIYY